MASQSPSPIQAIGSPSPSVDTPRDSPRFSASSQEPPLPPPPVTRTGLVSSFTSNGQRSYGTVKQYSSSFRRSNASVITYCPVEGDTLQGIALKYNVTVQDIERLNCVWSTESLFCKPSIKIPVSYHSNESSLANSPSASPGTQRRMLSSSDIGRQLSNGVTTSLPDSRTSVLNPGDEEVRSKNRPRRQRSESVTAECGKDGVKSIKDILNCADVQLQASKDFAEKLAKKSLALTTAKDAYHRTHDDRHSPSPFTPPNSLPVPAPAQDRESSPKSKRRLHLKRVDTTPEQMQASRDKLEDNLFEL